MMLPTRRRLLRGLLVVPVVLGLTLVAAPQGASASNGASYDHGSQRERQVTVMTRNLYLGAELTGVLAPDVNPIVALAQISGAVEASRPPARMAGVAAEIARTDPDVVALQEVADWQIPGKNPLDPTQQLVPAASYDFLALLLQDLAARGEPYHVVVSQRNFDSGQQLALAAPLATFVDRDVILARDDTRTSQLKVLNTFAAHYTAQLKIPVASLPGTPVITFDRGYEWADVKTRGKVWRVVNTHPEAYAPSELGLPGADVNGPEAQELVTALAGVSTPVVVLGDLNSAKGETLRPAYATLVGAGFVDQWLALGKPDSRNTCCRNADLSGGTLDSRIDHVLARGPVWPEWAHRVGVLPFRGTPPRWPSDHAGVVMSLTIGRW